MRKKFLLNILFIVLACVATLLTTTEKVEVFNKEDLRTVSCGWPLDFIVRNHEWRDPPYPYKTPCGFISLEETTVAFYLPQFVFDVLLFYFLSIFFYYMYITIKKHTIK